MQQNLEKLGVKKTETPGEEVPAADGSAPNNPPVPAPVYLLDQRWMLMRPAPGIIADKQLAEASWGTTWGSI